MINPHDPLNHLYLQNAEMHARRNPNDPNAQMLYRYWLTTLQQYAQQANLPSGPLGPGAPEARRPRQRQRQGNSLCPRTLVGTRRLRRPAPKRPSLHSLVEDSQGVYSVPLFIMVAGSRGRIPRVEAAPHSRVCLLHDRGRLLQLDVLHVERRPQQMEGTQDEGELELAHRPMPRTNTMNHWAWARACSQLRTP